MKTILTTLMVLLTSQMAFAGSAPRSLECSSASGRTQFNGEVPGSEYVLDTQFTIDGQSYMYYDLLEWNSVLKRTVTVQNATVDEVGSLTSKKPNFHFVIKDTAGTVVFTFLALPASINVKSTPNGEAGRFSALIVGKDPRTGGWSPTIQVSCKYSHEI
ncbi:MAG: hypothetical protein AAF203_05945 [Pseudomonadota bacterium]